MVNSAGLRLDRIDPVSTYQNDVHVDMHRGKKHELEGYIDWYLEFHQYTFRGYCGFLIAIGVKKSQSV
jgi:hypothetical protein